MSRCPCDEVVALNSYLIGPMAHKQVTGLSHFPALYDIKQAELGAVNLVPRRQYFHREFLFAIVVPAVMSNACLRVLISGLAICMLIPKDATSPLNLPLTPPFPAENHTGALEAPLR